MSSGSTGQIDTVMQETRLFPPSPEFSAKSRIGSLEAYQRLYDEAKADPEAFWARLAREELHWFKPFDKVLDEAGQARLHALCIDDECRRRWPESVDRRVVTIDVANGGAI